MTATRITLWLQAAILAFLAGLTISTAPASVIVNVTGQSVSIAAPEASTDPTGAGVVPVFGRFGGTGGGSRAQDMSKIKFQD